VSAIFSAYDLALEFPGPRGPVRVLDGISFELEAGATLALVGESGSGKTLTALAVLGLVPPPGRVVAGRAFFQERNLLRLPESELRALRGRALAIIFQDPLGALHPLLSIERQMSEVLEVHERLPRRAARVRAAQALGEVGLEAPERVLDSYPHELSGGMRQRVLIAMALLLRPAVVFADEPTSALDPHLQNQVLELLRDLQEQHGSALVLISHDLARVARFADRVQVLYAGRTVESAPARELFGRPLHPYTAGLVESTPRLDGSWRFPLPTLPGQPSAPEERPSGCAFHPRCHLARERCRREIPALAEVRGARGRSSACFEVRALLEGGPRCSS
jgi:oligopeptide/dipeptide ABC transporter ATP-binding protein